MTSKSDLSSTWADDVVAETYRAEWGRLLSLLVTRTRRLDLAEDALSEAFARASERWPAQGAPHNPSGWLYTTASRLIVGRLRAEAMHGRKAQLLAVSDNWPRPSASEDHDELGDDRLAVILLCSHPALAPEARSALALRLVVGTPTEHIARLFLVSRATMAARITRAKKKIVAAGIPLAEPVAHELPRRLNDVCRTIYLAFTAGYAPSSGEELLRTDLAGEAVELASVLHHLAPGASQVRSLYALLLLQHARRDARVADGQLVTLPQQDRARWRHDEIALGRSLVRESSDSDSSYGEELRLQSLIAREHCVANTASQTDWHAIARLYGQLEEVTASPIVRLNRAVAVAEASGPAAGLTLVDSIVDALQTNHRVYAVRADLQRRAGQSDLARQSYRAAIARCDNETEMRFLNERLDALG